MCINSFSILNGEMQTIGTGVYLAPSIVDHSCAPNAVVTFDGFKLRLRLIQELPTLDWNSVRISYIELMSSNHDRRKELKDRYYFDCDCRRCHTDDVDRHHYASKCPSCNDPIPAKVLLYKLPSRSCMTLSYCLSLPERRKFSSVHLWL